MFFIRYDKFIMFFMCFISMVSFVFLYDMINCILGFLLGNFLFDKIIEF